MSSAKLVTVEDLEKRRLLSLTISGYDPVSPTSGLTTALLAPSSGITLSSAATYVGEDGQGGTYTGFNLTSNSNTLSIPDGIILTSGLASYAQGTPTQNYQSWGDPGDSDLSALIGGTPTYDANILTLNFTVAASAHSLSFNLIFGSNEVPGSNYSDVFGAFLDGTQISFDNSEPIDVANSLVSYENDGGSGQPGTTPVNMPVGYDWLTTELTTDAPLASGSTHTLVLAIADAGDSIVDSGVFLANLTSSTATIGGASTGTTGNAGTFAVDQTATTVANTAGNVDVVVDRTGGSSGAATVDYTTSDGTAAAGTDYTATSGTLSFADGQTSATVSIPVLDNAAAAATSNFGLTLSNATGGATLGSSLTDTVTIQNSQSVVQLSSPTYSSADTSGSATLTVDRTGNTSASATVHYTTADGTALAGTDYTATSGTLTFAAGATSGTITVPLTASATAAASSTFTVSLSSPGGSAVLGSQTSATVTETNADSSIQFASATYTVTNDAGTVLLTVDRTGNLSSSATVQYATSSGTAIAGTDFTTTTGTLTFAASQASQTISVPLIIDAGAAASTTFTVGLSSAGGNGTPGSQSSTTVTEQNNYSLVQLASATYSAADTAGSVILTVDRTGNTSASATASYSTADGTALAGTDYTATSGTLTFAAGIASQTITVPLTAVAGDPPSSTFTVSLSNPGGSALLGSQTSATVTETNANSSIQFASATYSAANDAGTVVLTVDRTGNLSSSATVQYAAASGTALAGTDFTTTTGTLTFAASQASQTISIPLLADAGAAASTTFTVGLSSVGGNGELGTRSTSTVTEQNNHSLVQFAASTFSVASTAGTVVLTVDRTGNTSASVTVQYATSDGTALAGTDYTTTSGSLTFNAGQTSATLSVPLLPDPVSTVASFSVTLSAPTGSAVLGSQSATQVAIGNTQSQLAFDSTSYSANNTAESAVLTVDRFGDTAVSASVNWTTSPQTAVAGVDYTASSGTLSFAAGQSSGTISVPVLPNTSGDPVSTFVVTISDAGGNATLGTQTASTVTLANNHSLVQIVDPVYSAVSTATSVQVTVHRTGNTAEPASVNFTTADGSALADADYTPASGTLDFAAGASSETITVPIIPVSSRTSDTFFTLAISSPGQNAVLGSRVSTTITIAGSTVPVTPIVPVITISAFADTVSPTSATGTLHVAATENGTDANLIYTWQIISQPTVLESARQVSAAVGSPAPLALFAINGTNAAKNTAVTFLAPGSYTLRVTASNGTQSTFSDVHVTVAARAIPAPTTTQVAGVQPISNGATLSGFVVTFNGPVDPTTAQNVAGYRIARQTTVDKHAGFFNRLFNTNPGTMTVTTPYKIASAVYDSTTYSVTLTLVKPMPVTNGARLVQVIGSGKHAVLDANSKAIDGNADGKAGGTFTYRMNMHVAKTLNYQTASGDQVHLSLSGPGEIVTLLPAASKTPTLFLTNAQAGASTLSGDLHKSKKGTGIAVLQALNNSTTATVDLGNEFEVNEYGTT